ncbi:PREDICTED: F-box/LRR-repeat protein At3g26922-like [Erythranthe guttata]|uniref:F-box/LRR-repeat protein At3g26922-like n=1 Tax=Erythranthe guttata TaxID=4155 RepID=UPI00064DA43F|nr:PREDICTED: F-box/LRR-repeat protein At3g26922-like [Erythranthe guttata]|eukprot:XP_012827720.1 PREDICTED: F-box/LRR-repeat protein At3g26922-like [Erythranthe guttata]
MINNIDNDDDGVDKISQLPDDILVSIISWLPVAEAVCTSVLSTRWRELHRYITRLDFSPTSKQLRAFKDQEEERSRKKGDDRVFDEEVERSCASIIDRTLDSLKGGAALEEIRLYLPWFQISTWSDDETTWPIERWLDFALSKKFVRTVHLHLNSVHASARFPFPPCNFERNLPAFKSLKELSLQGVVFDDEGLRLLLSNSVALERLSISRNDALSDVRISGDLAPKLKHLNISTCWSIKTMEIRDMTNLESMRFHEFPRYCLLVIANVPRLVELDTDCIKIGTEILSRGNIISEQLAKVKHVELECHLSRNSISFQELVCFIDACPCLQRLEIKFTATRFDERYYRMKVVNKASNDDHPKTVKLSGLEASPNEVELGVLVVGKARALEEFIVEISPDKSYTSRERTIARLRKQFQPILQDSINFVVV